MLRTRSRKGATSSPSAWTMTTTTGLALTSDEPCAWLLFVRPEQHILHQEDADAAHTQSQGGNLEPLSLDYDDIQDWHQHTVSICNT